MTRTFAIELARLAGAAFVVAMFVLIAIGFAPGVSI